MLRWVAVTAALGLVACGPMTPEQAADRCEQRARDAQGPTGGVTVGVNSNSGGSVSASIGVTTDYLMGRDPVEVYEECVFKLTGEEPIRPPVLRNN